MKKLTTDDFIKRSKNIHGDKYDYSLVEYINQKTKVKIICPVHGIFDQTQAESYYDWLYKKTILFQKVFGKYIKEFKK